MLVFFLSCSCAQAQDHFDSLAKGVISHPDYLAKALISQPNYLAKLPESPKPKTIDKRFLISLGLLAAASTSDQITTERFLSRGCHELNPIFGPHPSPSKVAGVSLLYFGGEVGLSYVLKRFGRGHWWSKVWLAEPSWGTAIHIQASYHNEGLVCP